MDEAVSSARTLLEAWKAEDVSEIQARFWWPLTYVLTASRLKSLLSTITSNFGPLTAFTEPRLHQDGRIKTLKSLATFRQGKIGITIQVWGNEAVGVSIGAPISLGLVGPWVTPSYIDATSFTENDVSVRPSWLRPAVGGTLTLPAVQGRKPVVLMLPGSGPCDRDISFGGCKPFKDIAHGLASSGIAALRMDKPLVSLALEHFITKSPTIHDEYIPHNIEALKLLSQHPQIAPSKIFILGGSLGGGVAPRLCTASPVPVAGMISVAGACRPMVDTLIYQYAYNQQHFPKAKPEYEKSIKPLYEIKDILESGKQLTKSDHDPTKDLTLPVPLSYFRDDFEHRPAAIARTLSMPKLFMQGARDWQVTADQDFKLWQESLKGSEAEKNSTFKLYENLGHLMTVVDRDKYGMFQYDEPRNVDETVVKDLVAWIKEVRGF